MNNITEMLKGVLEGCVLEIISKEPTYGYEITRTLQSLGFTEVVDGTVYAILVRLEKSELVDVEKKSSAMGPPRKFFSLNEKGKKELEIFWSKWGFITNTIDKLKGDK